ncbi:Ankyrin repeat-containing domain protein [Naviculisporaceae sp. PSN 640]
MADIDLSAILAALASIERQPNNRSIKAYLLAKGIPDFVAHPVSMNELCYWTEEEVDLIFDRLHVSQSELRDWNELKSFTIQLSQAEIRAGNGPTDFVKPSGDEVERSARVGGALCVNRRGEFCINPAGGYAALSHVWSQGLAGDPQGRGLHRSLVTQVFDKLAASGMGNVKWIWTDPLAIPGAGEELTVVQEEIKAELINAMAAIYRNAKEVIVLDALLLRLASIDVVDVAVCLTMGKWLTRVWTYQEIKLASNPVVITKTGFVKFVPMVDTLREKAINEVGEVYDTSLKGQFPSLYRTFHRLQRLDHLGVSLPDIAFGCGHRSATDTLDHARALFPTLGLKWRFGDGIEQAMRKIYEAQKEHATRLVLYHGPPRAAFPGWAPAEFPGLVDSKIITPGVWKARGMEREWLTTKIRAIVPSKPGAIILELDNGSGSSPGAYCVGNLSKATEIESPASLEVFRDAVKKGTAYLLTEDSLIPKQHIARVGLLVERFTLPEPTNKEAWVIMTLAVGETQPSYSASREKWLLLHENPTRSGHDNGKGMSELTYLFTQSPNPSPPDADSNLSRYPLHRAAKMRDISTIHALTSGPGYVDVNEQDPRGWTPLHYAAASGQSAAISTLCNVPGATTSLTIGTRNAETPLVLAIDNGHVDAAMELLEAGADVNYFCPEGFSPLTTACRRNNIELVRLCLMMGADPNLEDGYSAIPLTCAVKEDEYGTAVLEELISAGAEVDAMCRSGASALFMAVRQGSLKATKVLLATKRADPNGVNKQISCLLQDAIEERHVQILEALLENGAKAVGGGKFDNGWTAMMCAASVGDIHIGRLLRAYGADMYAKGGNEGWTPLHVAAVKAEKLFFKWLVEEGKKEGRDWAQEKDVQGKTAFELRAWEK